jgi:uncharacterized integral membrane protein
MSAKQIFFTFLFIILITFILQNHPVVEAKFLLWSFKASGIIVYAVIFTAGILIGGLLIHLAHLRKKERK